ncbi:MAG TPA: hypothetical protein VF696_01145 [Candidatus Paceibacterota bacterium]
MPRPTFTLSQLGLWGTWELPTEPAVRVLTHLMQPGEPRLFVQVTGEGRWRGSVTNSEDTAGWSTKIDSYRYIQEGLLEVDPELTATCARSITAYRITQKGREAVVQFHAHREYRDMLRREVPKLIEEQRRKYGVSS